jgi:hypothetical protein
MKTKKEKKHEHNFIWNNRKHPKCKCGYNQSPKPEKKVRIEEIDGYVAVPIVINKDGSKDYRNIDLIIEKMSFKIDEIIKVLNKLKVS